ncbi:hypothetical protein [Streptomyces sp. NBC_01243]
MPALSRLLYRGLPEPATPKHLGTPVPGDDDPGAPAGTVRRTA